jgi:hypothetical protein
MYDYPMADALNFLFIKCLILLFGDYIVATNAFYLLTFPLTAFTTATVLRYLTEKRLKVVIGQCYDLTEGLIKRNYSSPDIALILGGNFERANTTMRSSNAK